MTPNRHRGPALTEETWHTFMFVHWYCSFWVYCYKFMGDKVAALFLSDDPHLTWIVTICRLLGLCPEGTPPFFSLVWVYGRHSIGSNVVIFMAPSICLHFTHPPSGGVGPVAVVNDAPVCRFQCEPASLLPWGVLSAGLSCTCVSIDRRSCTVHGVRLRWLPRRVIVVSLWDYLWSGLWIKYGGWFVQCMRCWSAFVHWVVLIFWFHLLPPFWAVLCNLCCCGIFEFAERLVCDCFHYRLYNWVQLGFSDRTPIIAILIWDYFSPREFGGTSTILIIFIFIMCLFVLLKMFSWLFPNFCF